MVTPTFKMQISALGSAYPPPRRIGSPSHAVLDWSCGYQLYAALLEHVEKAFTAGFHEQTVTPVGQYVLVDGQKLIWHISLLGETARQGLAEAIERQETYYLHKFGITLQRESLCCQKISDVDELFRLAAKQPHQIRLQFQTPTAFKSNGRYECLPTLRLILRSLVQKWNGCFADVCPIEDEDGEGLDAIAAGLYCPNYHLEGQNFSLKKQTIPGFVGQMTIANENQGFHQQLAAAILYFSAFSGVGIKTALGMGGVTIH